MENIDLQSNLEMMEDIDFEGKVDIDDVVLPPKPIKVAPTIELGSLNFKAI